MKMGTLGRMAFAVALALGLSACLTSEGPLFNSSNAKSRAFAEGAYEACQTSGAEAPDCQSLKVTRDRSGLYTFAIDAEGEAPTYARFKSIGRGGYAAQLWGPEDKNPFYFLVEREGDAIAMAMIVCESLPESFVEKYVARGELEKQDDTTCLAKTAAAVVAAAKAWRQSDAAKTAEKIVYRRK
jgi:hypothetical protein